MTSLASIVERYINQAQSKGDCARLVRYSDFLASFQNITHLLNVSEQRGIYTEVFTRSVTPLKQHRLKYMQLIKKEDLNQLIMLCCTPVKQMHFYAKKKIWRKFGQWLII